MKISSRAWGEYEGREISLIEIDNERGIRACVSNYGAILQALWVGELDVVLGYDTLDEYLGGATFFGASVGPLADRVGNACFEIGGSWVGLDKNAGPDCMHSGSAGFHARVWEWQPLSDGVAFHLSYEGFALPGRMEVCIVYRLMDENILRIEYNAKSDRETAASFTNHSYFNLDGGRNHCRQHRLTVHADCYAQTCREEEPICTGKTPDVSGTPLDLRQGVLIDAVLKQNDFPEIRTGGGIDHYLLVNGSGMREHARLWSEKSGLELICRSDAPGVLVYSANGLDAEPGKSGKVYGKNWGVCLETERFPNAVNLSRHRDQVLLQPDEPYNSVTEFEFHCKI